MITNPVSISKGSGSESVKECGTFDEFFSEIWSGKIGMAFLSNRGYGYELVVPFYPYLRLSESPIENFGIVFTVTASIDDQVLQIINQDTDSFVIEHSEGYTNILEDGWTISLFTISI